VLFRRPPPEFRGYIDGVQDGRILGWVWDRLRPRRRLDVEILSAGAPLGVARADGFREDLAAGGVGDGGYAFSFALPAMDIPRETIAARVLGTSFFLFDNAKFGDCQFLNSTARGLPLLRPALSHRVVDDADIAIAAELQRLWRAANGEGVASQLEDRKQMWGHIVASRHGALRAALNGGDARGLAECLVDSQKQSSSEGLMQGQRAYSDFVAASPEGRRAAVAPFHDMLASLVQYLGVERAECAEQDFQGAAIARDQEALAREIEAALAPRLAEAAPSWLAPPPVFDGLYGLALGDRVLHGRDIQALYAALRAIEASGLDAPAICEIGAGFGKVAHYAVLLGVRRYVVIDLPTVCAMQFFYLRKTLPHVPISLGETGRFEEGAPGIELVFAAHLPVGDRLKADIALNCDSFPEMGDGVCRDYFSRLPGWAPLLLSINQEAWREVRGPDHRQTVVGRLLPEFGFTRAYRFRSWVRRGYVEELWRAPRPAAT